MIICRWMKLFILRERKSVSHNLIRANHPSMECCINQSMLFAIHLPFQLLCILISQKQSRHLTTPGTSQTVKYLIQNLECHTNLVARNISYDRLYTSIPMAQWLLDRGKTSVGTLQSNRKVISAEIREINDRETNSYEIYWEKNNGI